MRVNIDPETKTTFPPEIVDLAIGALNKGRVFRNVELTGRFPTSGAVKFIGIFGFDMAVCKMDCEFFLDERAQRFAGEIMVNPAMNAFAWWPRFGWAPVLVAAKSVVQLQGRPGDTWSVIAAVAERGVTEADQKLAADGKVVPCPMADDLKIDCTPFVEAVSLEGRL